MGGGEIVEVQGGHIVRSTGRKDRHSKVCTAKGPRDRRVRLSAHTAIQFYDVQDRLGYDRPSKAVDWLIKKAKPAIDELAELPPWRPTATTISTAANTSPTGNNNAAQCSEQGQEEEQNQGQQDNIIGSSSSSSKRGIGGESAAAASGSGYAFQQQQMNNNNNNSNNTSSFLPPSLDSDAIADTIKSFFPMAAAVATSSSTIPFQNYPPDLLSRTSSQTQDLRLSLHSFHDPILLHHHHQTSSTTNPPQALFPSSGGDGPLGFDAWSEQQQQQSQEMGRFQRMIAWNSGDAGGGGGSAAGGGSGGGDYVFNSLPQAPLPLQLMQGQNPVFSQRGPLQSSNSPQVRAWIDQSCTAIDHHHLYPVSAFHQTSSTPGIGFASGGFTGFRIPARIQGEEEHDAANKRSSASRH